MDTSTSVRASSARNEVLDQCPNLSVVELSVHIDLSLSDVASQVGDGMGDV